MSIKDYHYDVQTDDEQFDGNVNNDDVQPQEKDFYYDVSTDSTTNVATAWPPPIRVFNDVIYYDMEYLIIKGAKLKYFKLGDDCPKIKLTLAGNQVEIKAQEIDPSNLPSDIKEKIIKEMI